MVLSILTLPSLAEIAEPAKIGRSADGHLVQNLQSAFTGKTTGKTLVDWPDGMSKLLVLGDSVVWGQGLKDQHKTARMLATHLGAEMTMMAHAGAKIGLRDSYTVTMPSAIGIAAV